MDWDKIDAHLAAALGESSRSLLFAVLVDRNDSLTPFSAMAAWEQLAELSLMDNVVRIRLATQSSEE